MTEVAERTETPAFLGHYASKRPAELPGAAWQKAARGAALVAVEAKGLPTRRVEAWKYTDVAALGVADFRPAEAMAAPLGAIRPLTDSLQIVLLNGFVVTPGPQALPPGVTIGRLDASLAADVAESHLGKVLMADSKPFAALNTALFADGVLIRIAAGTVVERPIELVSVGRGEGAPVSFHPRCLVVVEERAQATLVERHCGSGTYFSNAVVEMDIGAGALLRHYKLQDEAEAAVHVASLGITLGAQARYDGVVLHLGGRLARHEVHAGLDGSEAVFSLDGAYLGGGRQHVDNTTFVTHRAVGGSSRQVFKGVLDDSARGVFQGTLLVERQAQKTDAHQLSKALLLSGEAEMDGKPELEIYADDVKCGHGATVGDIDERALFYLRARGIDEETARGLLIEAFLAEVLEQIADEPMRQGFAAAIGKRLGGGHLVRNNDGAGAPWEDR